MWDAGVDGEEFSEQRPTTNDQRLTERRQFHQIVLRYRLQRFAGFAPGSQAADNDERVESFFPQQMRHPGAGCFARSSTVKINVLIFRKNLDFVFQVIGLDADGILDSRRTSVVIAMAADIDD